MEQQGLIQRLTTLIGSEKPFAWAARIGIPAATFSRIWNEGGQIKSEILLKISEATGCSVDWLLTGEGPMRRGEYRLEHGHGIMRDGGAVDLDEYALVPRYNVEVSAGGGALVDNEAVIGSMAFKREWLRRMGFEVAKLALVTARGDSMLPTMADGDLLLVDLRQTEIVDGAIHVIRNDGHLLAKRLQLGMGDQVIVRSDNGIYSALQTKKGELDVIGRVVWRGGRM